MRIYARACSKSTFLSGGGSLTRGWWHVFLIVPPSITLNYYATLGPDSGSDSCYYTDHATVTNSD